MTAKFPPEPSVSNMKAQIHGILDSYHRDYDVLAELIQNGIDAIKKRYDSSENKFQGKLEIYINSSQHQIKVLDNGNGMSKEMLERSVTLNESGKRKDVNSVGEKGVGLSFSIFKAKDATIRTNDGEKGYRLSGKGARDWLANNSNEAFEMDTVEDNNFINQGTEVNLVGVDSGQLFQLSWEQMEFVIRTLTAAGDTNFIFDNNEYKINITLSYDNSELGIYNKTGKIPFQYFIFDGISPNQRVEFDDFKKKFKDPLKSDAAKREFFKGKYVVMRGKRQIADRIVPWIAIFSPNGNDWNIRNERVKLSGSDDYKLLVEPEYARLRPWATLSVKGMPTGIEISTSDLTGALGYLPRMFFLIQDDGAHFDLGRKTVKGSTTAMYKDVIKKVFNKYKTIASKYIVKDRDPVSNETNEDKSVKFNELKKLPKMTESEEKITHFENLPDQEGTISAIFFELLGREKIKDLKLFRHGYSDQYDLYAQYNLHDITLDFKQRLRGFVADIQKDTKRWNDLDYLVMWCLDKTDEEVATANGVDITPVEKNPEHLMATAYLSTNMSDTPIYVIELKKLLKNDF